MDTQVTATTRKRKAPMGDDAPTADANPCCDIAALPPEILSMILVRLGDRDFVACLFAARAFHLDDPAAYEARAKRWRGCTTPADFCRVGNIDALNSMYDCGDLCGEDALELVPHAVAADQADVFAWLCSKDKSCVREAAGHLAGPRVLTFLIDRHCDVVYAQARKIIRRAIHRDQLDVVRLMDRTLLGDHFDGSLDYAASETRLDIVAYLQERRPESGSPAALDCAAANGDIEMARLLCDSRSDGCGRMAIAWAAQGGHVPIMDLLRRRYPDARCSENALPWAASGGRLEAVVWLHGPRRAPCIPGLVSYCSDPAVRSWIERNGCPCSTKPAHGDAQCYYMERLLNSEWEGYWEYHRGNMEARLARRRSVARARLAASTDTATVAAPEKAL
ncbi:ankyrin repeat domain containing protein [Pandoravirus japonicus]|uniref:Ankyrin repeat domain containing protein n=1 Tax=Pandoravirus japonicus TaxID=2823154 RepID=A0A811BPG2_9VIRU|nr:ankyrin repeat domain containing protein [Pandoravirus japonicus]